MEEDEGYLSSRYAESLAPFGVPRKLVRSGGWILRRQIPGCSACDAMGFYPIFSCRNWSELGADLGDARIVGDLVSLVVVTDPLGAYEVALLKRSFEHLVVPFKQHYIIDLSSLSASSIEDHHRRNARKAAKEVVIGVCEHPGEYLNDWIELYKNLIERHGIKGMTTFSKDSFASQLEVPGRVVFRATSRHRNEKTVGMNIWYRQGEIAYYHLGAYSQLGYELKSSFALFKYAIDYFATTGIRLLSLGAAAGVGKEGEADGLARFKRGWATGTRATYLCGRIFDRKKYDEITSAKGLLDTDYFPAYRKGEF